MITGADRCAKLAVSDTRLESARQTQGRNRKPASGWVPADRSRLRRDLTADYGWGAGWGESQSVIVVSPLEIRGLGE